MKLQQLSLFLENKPGSLREAYQMLADNGINIETMTLAETEQYGILRILVKDWERAREVCERNGVPVRIAEVVALAVEHHPGGLAEILGPLDDAGLNIEYMYGFSQRVSLGEEGKAADAAIIVFRFDNPDIAIETLKKHNVRVIGDEELFREELFR